MLPKQLQGFLEENVYLDSFQTGFRPGYIWKLAWSPLLITLVELLIEGGGVSLLDLLECFHMIDHGIIPEYLSDLGVGKTILQWFYSSCWQVLRRQMLGDHCSSSWKLPVVWGYHEIWAVVSSVHWQHANLSHVIIGFQENLNQCLEEIMEWMRANKLKCNHKQDGGFVGTIWYDTRKWHYTNTGWGCIF